MSFIIPIIIVIAAVPGFLLNAFILDRERDDWKQLLKILLVLSITALVVFSVLNYFWMVKVIGIYLVMLFMLFFTLSFWAGYVIFKSKKIIPGVLLAIVFILLALSPLMMTTRLYEVTGVQKVEGKPVEIDTTHIRQVNYEYAKWKADKVIGEMGNRLEIGELEIILYQGRLTWVCPLIHRGFLKEWEYDTTPGYILVDGEDPTREAVFFEGYEIDFAYEGDYFGEYMHRIVYREYPGHNQYWSFEIDENGSPWVIVTLTQPTVSYSGAVPIYVLLISPLNKSIIEYGFGFQPGWIDNAFPEELAERYCEWWGKYRHGFWNTIIAEKDVKSPTAKNNANSQTGGGFGTDVYLVVGNDNQTYWFTDFTSPASSDQSMVGYALVNTHTGEMNFYAANGLLNGEAAMEATTAKVTNFQGWYATQPIFLIIDGNETWFTPVHSGTNILQKVALVKALDGDVTIGDTLEEVLLEYQTGVQESGTVETLAGNVTAIYSYVVDGATEWYIEVDGIVIYSDSDSRPFLISIGDVITVQYQVVNNRNVMVDWS